ncbi:MAG: DUF4349 domain-containing protein [Anaerolineae bacterium]|nr:DUF4349 domain-containing protein [Anaerolineae bacterium]
MMNAKRLIGPVFLLACLILILIACGAAEGPQAQVVEVTRVVTETVVETVELEGVMVEVTHVVVETVVMAEGDTAAPPQPIGTAVHQTAQQQRLIIKNGHMHITVEDTDTAVNQATDTAVQLGGYIISQQVWDDGAYRFATMRLAVPVLRFEDALRAFRALGTVTNEAASGEDVTDQYVDLQSRLDNLLATRDRLRAFLAQATTIEEALRINEELKQVEEEIAVIQGRLHYLADRAAFSTVDLTLNPFIPTPTPQPTVSPPPLPTPAAWNPGDTAQLATLRLTQTSQSVADFTLYRLITWTPWLLLLLLMAVPVRRLYHRYWLPSPAKPSRPQLWTPEDEEQAGTDNKR